MADERILDCITSPHQLRRLSESQLTALAGRLRERIIQVVSRNGGHLASNLGITELTIALHYVFDFSRDHLLWDVGHQCYAHKLLTGRDKAFETLRQRGGMSGFPDPHESAYDLFATGHAGTAISTALGMAWADQAAGRKATRNVAVVGDASIVNGLSMEGINNVSLLNRQLLIILNDNSMAIDRTSGAMARMLDRVRMTHTYEDLRQSTESLLRRLPVVGDGLGHALQHIKQGLKTTIYGAQLFEGLGFSYFGPIDGHDVIAMIHVLQRLAQIQHPVLLHVYTQKGRGCEYAIEDPCRFHSPSAYTVQGGWPVFPPKTRRTWTDIFGDALVELGDSDERVVAITAAMPDGAGLVKFRSRYPKRYIDVGICESNALAMAGGLAKGGLRPVVAVYSTFMQRAMDQVFQEICLQNLPVLICMDRAGLVGADGAVHHGFMDIAQLRPMPGMVLMAPADAPELSAALKFGMSLDGPAAIRYPRDDVPADLPDPCPPFELGKARVITKGDCGAFLCYGAMVEQALEAAETLKSEHGLSVGVVNARFAKPLDVALISALIASGKPLLVCEDHAVIGGFGAAVLEMACERGLNTVNVRLLGLPDRFVAHASRREQLVEVGLDAVNLAATMRDLIQSGLSSPLGTFGSLD